MFSTSIWEGSHAFGLTVHYCHGRPLIMSPYINFHVHCHISLQNRPFPISLCVLSQVAGIYESDTSQKTYHLCCSRPNFEVQIMSTVCLGYLEYFTDASATPSYASHIHRTRSLRTLELAPALFRDTSVPTTIMTDLQHIELP